jgi:hypothetical protein
VKVEWGLDLKKQQRTLLVLDNKSNGEVNGFSGVWDGPLWTDVIAIGCREPIVQNLVIKGVKLCLNGLVVVVQFGSFVQDILWVATVTKTKYYRKYQSYGARARCIVPR